MRTLHVRHIPEELYTRLQSLAQAQQLPLNELVVGLLERALETEQKQQEQAQILEHIRRNRFTPQFTGPDDVEMLREDRNR